MRRVAVVMTGFGLSIASIAACAPRSVETVSPGEVATTRAVRRSASDVLASWPEKLARLTGPESVCVPLAVRPDEDAPDR